MNALQRPLRRIRSIRGRLFIVFLALAGLTAAFGVYAVASIESSGKLVSQTYDRPLMAINFARSALFAFSSMDRELGRSQLPGDESQIATHSARIEQLSALFYDDLAVARQRSLSSRTIMVIDEIDALVDRWNALRVAVVADGIDADEWEGLDRLSADIVDRFDLLIDLTAGDGFVMRQNALGAITDMKVANTVAVVLVVMVSLMATLMLGRRILVPLNTAVDVAERIAAGDLSVDIPAPGDDETGALLQSMAVMRDNLRRMVEHEVQARKSAQSRLIDAIESSPEMVVLIDAAGSVVLGNSQIKNFFPTAAHLFRPGANFGGALREVSWSGLIEARDEADSAVERYVAARVADRAVGEVKLADGRWLRLSFSRTRDGGTVAIGSDITEIKERERSLQLAKEQAEAANTAKSTFLASISHELRTPLNAIIGFSEILSNELLGPIGQAQYREYAADILGSGRHLLGIINDLLDLSKSEAGALQVHLEEFEIIDILDECRRLVDEQCKHGKLTLDVACAPDAPMILADASRMKQILINLLSNAVKFTPEQGRIEVNCTRTADGGLCVVVSDTGIGMAPDDIAVALEPFGQVDSSLARRYEGTGLGLPLTKRLVEMHQGTLTIDSTPEIGTRVILEFPPMRAAA